MKVEKVLVAIGLMALLAVGSTAQAGVVADWTFDDLTIGAGFNFAAMTDFSGSGHPGQFWAESLVVGVNPHTGSPAVPLGVPTTSGTFPLSFGQNVAPRTYGLANGSFTMEIVADFTDDGRGQIIGIGDNATVWWDLEQEADGKILFQPGPGGGPDYTQRSPEAVSGWHSFALVIDRTAGNSRMYLDGGLISTETDTWSQAGNNLDHKLRVGLAPWNSTANGFNGLVDRVRISNHVVDPGDMLQVPEPMTLGLLGLGGLLLRRRGR